MDPSSGKSIPELPRIDEDGVLSDLLILEEIDRGYYKGTCSNDEFLTYYTNKSKGEDDKKLKKVRWKYHVLPCWKGKEDDLNDLLVSVAEKKDRGKKTGRKLGKAEKTISLEILYKYR
ncbi:hypothetical protein ACH5RR_038285 [Cinchona calisaya]|uniref:Uncharacterized protein n=1 Tax=Cinchona calisaya TaxID=153742 RepID=A0ABD2XY48_9GENT